MPTLVGYQPSEGGGGVHAAIVQESAGAKGVEIAIPYDATWKLEGVQRNIGQRGYTDLHGGVTTADNYVRLTAPTHFTGDDDQQQEVANGQDLRVIRGTDRVAAVAAVAAVAEIEEVKAFVHLFHGTGALDYILVERNTGGTSGTAVQGNDWDITFAVTTAALTDGVQVTTGTDGGVNQLQVLIQSENIPTVTDTIAAINGHFSGDFSAARPPGATNIGQLMSTLLTRALPDGTTTNNTRHEDFAGGVNGVAGVDAVPAVVGVEPQALSFLDNLSFQGDAIVNDRWELTVNNEATLDEIAEFLRTAVVGVHSSLVDFSAQGTVAFGTANVEVIGDGSLTLRSSSHSINGQNGSLPSVVGAFALHELQDAVNPVPAEVTLDDANKIITVSYDVSDTAVDVRDLFEGIAEAVLIADTEDDAELEAPPFERAFRGVGGAGGAGGAGAKVTTDVTRITFEEGIVDEIDFTATNVAVDTGIAVPANTKTIALNYGAATSGDDAGIDLTWFITPIEEWNRLESVDVGDGPTQVNARFARTWRDTNIGTGGGVAARQVWLGKGNNGNIFLFSDNVGYDIYPFRVRFEIHETVTVLESGGVGGASGSETTLIPETNEGVAFTEDDEHNIININGKLYEVIRDHQDGHGKTVGLKELTHTNFRGFVSRVNDLLTPADGQFVYVYSESTGGIGGFERYTTAGVTGFYPYRPFDAGNEWENAPTGADYTYVGALNYRGYRQDEADLIRVAAAAGEAFVQLDERQVMFVDTFTEPTADYDYYKKQSVVPVNFNNPVGYLWLNGQTERYPQDETTFPYTTNPANDKLRFTFNGADPDQGYFRGEDVFEGIMVAAADVSADLDGGGAPVAATANVVFSPPAGLYDFRWELQSEVAGTVAQIQIGVALFRVQAGVDDQVLGRVLLASTPGGEAPGRQQSTGAGIAQEITVASGEQLYLMAFSGGENTLAPVSSWRGYLRIEKKT